jgi:hypothetical protein
MTRKTKSLPAEDGRGTRPRAPGPHHMQPATTVIARLGGPRKVAKLANTTPTVPYHWRLPVARHGTDGRIPQRYHRLLLAYAKAHRIPLTAADLLPAE